MLRTTITKSSRLFITTLAIVTAFFSPLGNIAFARFPDKPIHLIVPFPPGGPSDFLGRLIAQKLGEALHETVIVENKPGAGTNIAAQYVARSAPDGYTLFLMMVGTQAINEVMYSHLEYNTVRDFTPITLIASSSLMLVAQPSTHIKSLQELIAAAKEKPGEINYASSGLGTPLHMAGELLESRTGIKLTHIPYKGASPALNAILSDQVQLAIVGTPSALPFIESGKLIGLGVTGHERDAKAPNIPTIGESLPGYEVELVYAIVVPTKTPTDVISSLNKEIVKIVESQKVLARFSELGFNARTSTPDQAAAYVREEISRWAPIVKRSGVKVE